MPATKLKPAPTVPDPDPIRALESALADARRIADEARVDALAAQQSLDDADARVRQAGKSLEAAQLQQRERLLAVPAIAAELARRQQHEDQARRAHGAADYATRAH